MKMENALFVNPLYRNYAVLSHFRGEKPHIFCDNDLTSSGTLCGPKFRSVYKELHADRETGC